MPHTESQAADFEKHRAQVTRVADRVLSDHAGAEDAVQECWLRLQRTDAATIDNLAGWLTTTTARICLDMLRRRARVDLDDRESDDTASSTDTRDVANPAVAVDLAEAVGEALAVVVEALNPPERVAFVLHDTFGISFDDIGAVLERSPAAAKQLATRARTKIRGADSTEPTPTRHLADHARVVHAFLGAARGGDLAALVGVLHPDIVLCADQAAIAMGSPALARGAEQVAAVFSGRAQMAVAGWIDDVAGMVWEVGGRTKVAWEFTINDGAVTRIDMIADTDTLAAATISTATISTAPRTPTGDPDAAMDHPPVDPSNGIDV
jgi:RNA polymerase sigma factor (sigma-70 family)